MRVYVLKINGRRYLQLRWKIDGVWKQMSAKTTSITKATQQAQQIEKFGGEPPTWPKIVGVWKTETGFGCLEKRTQESYQTAFNRFGGFVRRKTTFDDAALLGFVSALRGDEMSEHTIRNYVRHCGVVFRWMVRRGWLERAPFVSLRRRGGRLAKGRPLTLEEFERYLDAVAGIVGDAAAESWRFDARLLWHSGLRLSEAYVLKYQNDGINLQIQGMRRRHPMLWVPEGFDKSGLESLTPLTPEFVATLQSRDGDTIPVGHVFRFEGCPRVDNVSRVFADIGRAAGVVTAHKLGAGNTYASAHDFRRSFATRWAKRVPAPVLKRLMRHQSVSTTLGYYADISPADLAEVIYRNSPLAMDCTDAPMETDAKGTDAQF